MARLLEIFAAPLIGVLHKGFLLGLKSLFSLTSFLVIRLIFSFMIVSLSILSTRGGSNMLDYMRFPLFHRLFLLSHYRDHLISSPLSFLGILRGPRDIKLGRQRFKNPPNKSAISKLNIKRHQLIVVVNELHDVLSHATDTIILCLVKQGEVFTFLLFKSCKFFTNGLEELFSTITLWDALFP